MIVKLLGLLLVISPFLCVSLSTSKCSAVELHSGRLNAASWDWDEFSDGIDLRGIPGPYSFRNFCLLPWGEFWAVGGDGSVTVEFPDGTRETQHPTQASLMSVCGTATGRAWAAGTGGTIIHTDDWGKHWTQQKSGVLTDLESVTCIDELYCWAVGRDGVVLLTDDGGERWTRASTRVNDILYAVSFVDRNTGWAVGENGVLIKSIDGGHTWSVNYLVREMFPGSPGREITSWNAVKFWNRKLGWVAGYEWIATTGDGGQSWTYKHAELFSGIGIGSPDGVRVWAVANEWVPSINYWSTDSGRTWSKFNGKIKEADAQPKSSRKRLRRF
ncbi:MAG TPA: YCF48-related protein [Blastocatellia bacterium]|nr:YCF48-related protein [Blastocatellia bacterium]